MNATIARIRRLTADALPAGDGPLLDAFLAGDQTAFAALVRRHAGPVFATCRRVLRHQQDAEDAFQATFLVLARRAADVWPREAVGSWLFGVAHRVALKARAVRSRRAVREQPLEEVASAERPAPDFDLAEAVHRAVLKLPEVYRAAVVACDLEGLSRKEAAERLGWTEGTLSGRLARARDLLARRLRRSGLSLPAGLVALATTDGASAATVQTTIDLATGTAATAPAAVAALTEGVVRSMALLKLKAMAGAVFTACALGFGAFAATGVGTGGDQPGQKQSQTQGSAGAAKVDAPAKTVPPAEGAVRPGPRTELARQELEVLLQEIEFAAVAGKLDKGALDRLRGRLRAADRLLDPNDLALEVKRPASSVTDRDRLQGTWRVVALTEGGKTTPTNLKDPWVVEVTSRIIRMPYLETEGGWKQREYVFGVNEAQSPRTIDLVAPNKPVGYGIYEFTAPAKTCMSCHETTTKQPAVWALGLKPAPNMIGLCGPGLKTVDLGVRLAVSIDGTRPVKFGGPGVIVFEMKRPDTGPTNVAEATLAVQRAKLLRQEAEAQFEAARAQLEVAAKKAEVARQNLGLAESALVQLEKPPAPPAKDGPVFTVHVRTLTAAEKLIRVKATGNETVLDALEYVADDALLKSEGVSSWVVRGKTVLPVDLPGLLKHGKTTTNYQLFAGDLLFVQVKPAK